MRLDDRQLTELIHESQDVHSGTMRATRAALDEIVQFRHETRARDGAGDPERRGYIKKALFASCVVGAGFGGAVMRNSFIHVFAAGTDLTPCTHRCDREPRRDGVRQGGRTSILSAVSWTNQDPQPNHHTANAYGGAFTTGSLAPGQSGTSTFTTPGRYT